MVVAQRLLPERRCSDCRSQESWGCEKDATYPQLVLDAGSKRELKTMRCPVRLQFEEPVWWAEVTQAWRFYQKGLFPDPGTWLDQPVRFLVLMVALDRALDEAEREYEAMEERRKVMADQLQQTMKSRGN